jgi:hypothetical protein
MCSTIWPGEKFILVVKCSNEEDLDLMVEILSLLPPWGVNQDLQIIRFVLIRIIVSLFNPTSPSYPFSQVAKGHVEGELPQDFLFGLL